MVLPAILALLGTRVNSLAPAFLQRAAEREARPAESGFWYRLSRFVMRRPGPIAAASATLLIALGIPFLRIKFTAVDATVLPTAASARQVDTAMKTEFPPHRDSPIRSSSTAPTGPSSRELSAEARAPAGRRGGRRQPQRLAGGRRRDRRDLPVRPAHRAQPGRSSATIRDLPARAGDVQVTGFTADFIDRKSSLAATCPWRWRSSRSRPSWCCS